MQDLLEKQLQKENDLRRGWTCIRKNRDQTDEMVGSVSYVSGRAFNMRAGNLPAVGLYQAVVFWQTGRVLLRYDDMEGSFVLMEYGL